jgi:hypothetical protein
MNISSLTLTAAALVACASAASAAVVTATQTRVTGPTTLPIEPTQTFNQSPVPLASLSDTITENLTEVITFTNIGSGSGSFSGYVTNVATKTFPAGFTATVTNMGAVLTSGVLAAGASITKTGTGTATATAVGTPSMFAAFEGTGTVSATVEDIGVLSCTAIVGTGACGAIDTGEVIDVLSYDFTTPAPEPAALTLLSTALAGFGSAWRRGRS